MPETDRMSWQWPRATAIVFSRDVVALRELSLLLAAKDLRGSASEAVEA